MLADSNIIIYAAKPEYPEARRFIADKTPVVCAISRVEVLGYHQLGEAEKRLLETFFETATVLPISEVVLDQAIALRQRKKMTLGDSLVAATCLVHELTLVTRNTKDFEWITELALFNPFEADDTAKS